MAKASTGTGKRRAGEVGVGRSGPRSSLRPTLGRVRRLTAGLVHHRFPVWSGDGRHLAFRLGEGGDSCWVMIDRKGRLSRVIPGPADGGASFAPDGSLAYGRAVGATSEIWLLPGLTATGSGPTEAAVRRLLGGDGRLYCDPAFSPDGRYLAYIADDGLPGTARRLWRLDLHTDEHSLLVAALPGPDTPSRLAHPMWSPDGAGLYFEAMALTQSAIYFLPLSASLGSAGAAPQRLTTAGYRRPAPVSLGTVLCERVRADGQSQLVLLSHQPAVDAKTATVHEVPLRLGKGKTSGEDCLRDPAVGHSKRGLWLAFAATARKSDREPARCELFAARMQGLSPVAQLVRTADGGPDKLEIVVAATRIGEPEPARCEPIESAAGAQSL